FGAVRRDRESGVGAILAATPITRGAYLAGKLAAHAVSLHAVGLAALVSGLAVFLRYGTGPLQPLAFLVPFLAYAPPAIVITAAMAIFFDAVPGLRSRGGPVLYFFAWAFWLLMVPMAIQGGLDHRARYDGPIVFDPLGMVTLIG